MSTKDNMESERAAVEETIQETVLVPAKENLTAEDSAARTRNAVVINRIS